MSNRSSRGSRPDINDLDEDQHYHHIGNIPNAPPASPDPNHPANQIQPHLPFYDLQDHPPGLPYYEVYDPNPHPKRALPKIPNNMSLSEYKQKMNKGQHGEGRRREILKIIEKIKKRILL